MKDKIKKYYHKEIYSIELKEIEITEKTKILFNESNQTDFTHIFNTIQYNLIINELDTILYYNEEKEQAIYDYQILLRQYIKYIEK